MKKTSLGATGILAATLLLTATLQAPAYSQQTTASSQSAKSMTAGVKPLPTNVLLFPAVIIGADNAVAKETPATKVAGEIVTEAVRKYLTLGGVGVVVYSNRLPSVQRAVNEGQGISPTDAVKGPADDARVAQKLAEVTGASEYITISVDNYNFDPQTRRATFNLSLERKAADGSAISSAAEKAVGESPADVSGPQQQESAIARAAEEVAEKSVIDVFPQSAVLINPPKVAEKKKKRSNLGWLIPVVTLGGILAAPR
ncbi:MAG: hypothetical protein SFU56_15865 [Capsulimonadales bacterium]|nr:hypothetical protein [Capsulimonadales bacterium]